MLPTVLETQGEGFATQTERSPTHSFTIFFSHLVLGTLFTPVLGFASHKIRPSQVTVVKNPPVNAGDTGGVGSILGLGKSPRGGKGNPLQYSCLENPMDRGAWPTIVHAVSKSQTGLND